MKLKIGNRYYSQACDTEVIVVKSTAEEVELTCAGQPMSEQNPKKAGLPRLEPDPGSVGGSQLGKRYSDETGTIELLVVKPGAGTLAVDGQPLQPKAAKALPSSD